MATVYTNYIRNPSAEVDTTAISAAAAGVTITRVATGATKGSWAIQSACSGAAASKGSTWTSSTGIGGSSVPIDAQFDITDTTGGISMAANVRWFYTDATNAFGAFHSFSTIVGTAHITMPQVISSASKTLDYFTVSVLISGTTNLTFQVDGVSAGDSTMYIDGAQGADYAWVGTAHNSASTYTVPPNGYVIILPIAGTNGDAPVLDLS